MISAREFKIMASEPIQIPGYEILRPLGSGGMSTVFLALQRSLDRNVALKVMRRSGDMESADARQIERRFLLEGRMMAKLPHRNIAAVYDIVSNESISYIAMEYLGGGALTERMRSGIDLAEAVSVIAQIAGALEFAHGHNVVHRDLKPANIMFRDTGTPVLTDFGIARYEDGSTARLTQTGMLVGTPTYMSPEQINGINVDGRADQYSLGILFYELLTGSPPFRGDTPIAVLMAHLTQQPAPLPLEFRSFQDVFDRMLQKDREARYPNLQEFVEDLKSRLISSNTLLMRLQLDPEQSSSEQLRALGFHTSTPGTGALRASLSGQRSVVKAPTPNPVVAKPAAASAVAPKPKVRPAKPAPKAKVPASASAAPPALPRWLWPGVAAVVVLLAAGIGWYLFGGSGHQLSPDERELVRFWAETADKRIRTNELVVAAPGSDGSAFQYVQKIQQKDPGNARAQELLVDIVRQLGVQAEAALAEGNLDRATELDDQGLMVQPENADLANLKTRIAAARQPPAPEQPAVPAPAPGADLAATRERIDKLLGTGNAPDLRSALGEFAALAAAAPDAKETGELRARLIDALGTQMQKADSVADFDAWDVLVAAQQPLLGSDPAFVALTKAEPRWRAKIAAAAQERADALRGELVINAYPWGSVESVLDANRQPVKLPADATTPLLLSLPAGSYVVTVRHPQAAKSTQVIAKVEAKKRAVADAAFPTITSQEYFSRAGW
jgi:serine/threonine protein kinase